MTAVPPPRCTSCGQPMQVCADLGPDGYVCDGCEIGATVDRRVLGHPVVVEFYRVEYGAAIRDPQGSDT